MRTPSWKVNEKQEEIDEASLKGASKDIERAIDRLISDKKAPTEKSTGIKILRNIMKVIEIETRKR